MKRPSTIEKAAWCTGVALLVAYGASRLSSAEASASAIANFNAFVIPEPNTSTWSARRLASYREAVRRQATPEALLRIPALELTVPVFTGTSDWNLDRGAGHIENTAVFGPSGNAGIAGHRDGFFRALQNIRVGDELYVDTIAVTREYRVVETLIVVPTDVSVLSPTSSPTVTLVTCYPFYYVGPAPRRFIVRARAVE